MGESTDVDQIKRSLQKIEAALLGDEYHPEGLLKRFDKLEKKVEQTDKKIDRTDRKILAYVSIVSGFISAISFFIKKLF